MRCIPRIKNRNLTHYSGSAMKGGTFFKKQRKGSASYPSRITVVWIMWRDVRPSTIALLNYSFTFEPCVVYPLPAFFSALGGLKLYITQTCMCRSLGWCGVLTTLMLAQWLRNNNVALAFYFPKKPCTVRKPTLCMSHEKSVISLPYLAGFIFGHFFGGVFKDFAPCLDNVTDLLFV